MYTEKKITGFLTLDEKDKKSIQKTINIVEELDGFSVENDCSVFDFIANHYESYHDFLYDLSENTQETFKLLLDYINEH